MFGCKRCIIEKSWNLYSNNRLWQELSQLLSEPFFSRLTIKSSLHQRALQSRISFFSSAFALRTLDNSWWAHLLLHRLPGCIYLATCLPPLQSVSSHVSWWPSQSSIWAYRPRGPRADYILDITTPDVYDENRRNVNLHTITLGFYQKAHQRNDAWVEALIRKDFFFLHR